VADGTVMGTSVPASPKSSGPGVFAGATLLIRGFSRLFRRDIRSLVVAPVMMNIVVFSAGLWVAAHYFGVFLHWILPAWLDFLSWLLWPLFGLIFVVLVFFTFTLLANVLGAPFHALLADKLLDQAGVLPAGRRENMVRSAWRSISAELLRLRSLLLRLFPVLVLFVIPGVNVVAPLVWLGFTAWYVARDYFSYPLDTLDLPFGEQEARLRELGTTRLLFGLTVQLALSVPLLNIFVPPAAIAAASLSVIDRERRQLRAAK
jgi:CysZ protein